MDSSLAAHLSKKVPETENLCSSPPLIVCRTASKNPADLKLAVLVGLAPYYLRHICDRSIPRLQSLPVKDKQLGAWTFSAALKWSLCLAAFIPNFASLALL